MRGAGLLPPLGACLRFTNRFEDDVRALSPDRIAIVNERLADLALALIPGSGYNPPSLGYKKLAGDPHPPSTHEARGWSDGGAWRIFGHREGDFFIVDRLGAHL